MCHLYHLYTGGGQSKPLIPGRGAAAGGWLEGGGGLSQLLAGERLENCTDTHTSRVGAQHGTNIAAQLFISFAFVDC